MKVFLAFRVLGTPKPAGSKRGFIIRKNGQPTGRVAVVDACQGSREWKGIVADKAAEMMKGSPCLVCPIKLSLTFHLQRPKGHFRTGRKSHELRASAPSFPTGKPDALKLARAVEDALTGIVWRDDAQIVLEHLSKVYGSPPGCQVEVEALA